MIKQKDGKANRQAIRAVSTNQSYQMVGVFSPMLKFEPEFRRGSGLLTLALHTTSQTEWLNEGRNNAYNMLTIAYAGALRFSDRNP